LTRLERRTFIDIAHPCSEGEEVVAPVITPDTGVQGNTTVYGVLYVVDLCLYGQLLHLPLSTPHVDANLAQHHDRCMAMGEEAGRSIGPEGWGLHSCSVDAEDGERVRALAAAMANPLRGELLAVIAENTESGVSVRQLAEKMHQPGRRVRYHLDALAHQGLITVVREQIRRGAAERFYRVELIPMLSTEAMELIDDAEAQQVTSQAARCIFLDMSAAVAAGIFGARRGSSAIRRIGEVDLRGWEELSAIHDAALAEAQAVFAKCEKRLADSAEGPIRAIAALLLFEPASTAPREDRKAPNNS
jgi:DNA-binding transcriptional ArsR family regulator